MTIRAHAVPDGGLSHVLMTQNGTFCPDLQKLGYEWLRDMWTRFAVWQLKLNQKVSTQPGFFINTSQYKPGDLYSVTWTFNFEYFYAGEAVKEVNYKLAFDYLLSMHADQFTLNVTNLLPPPHPPSDAATSS
ncbi:hypothetical protein N0V95_003229 [Ascochyta clinopodiicola]|nr:hypothetical protein N0V95_003229 [Ascochyta clinopodiicola]